MNNSCYFYIVTKRLFCKIFDYFENKHVLYLTINKKSADSFPFPVQFSLAFHFHYRLSMTSSTQTIPEEFLDWCFKNNISESTGKDKDGLQIKLIHYAAEKGYIQVVKKLVDSGIEVDSPAPNPLKKLHFTMLQKMAI